LHKDAQGAINMIALAPDLPPERVDESALLQRMQEAAAFNADIETRKGNRQRATDEITRLRGASAEFLDGIEPLLVGIRERHGARAEELRGEIADLESRLQDLRGRLGGADRQLEVDLEVKRTQSKASAQRLTDQADGLQAKLEGADPLPDPVDPGAIRLQIDDARRLNIEIDKREKRVALQGTADKYKAESDALTGAIERRATDRQEAIAAAKMPIEGLGFGDGEITLNGLPFDQASDAERLRASMAIAIAQNPKLRVLRIREGSLLDDDGLKLVEEVCAKNDFQCWIEQVDSSGKIGFVISEGELAKAAE
jgi:TolA-binding protein